MKILLATTAGIEEAAGLALGCCPSFVVALLLGSPLAASAAVALGRLTGAALLALGVACWLARGDEPSSAARGLVGAMLVYNLGAVVILGTAGLGSKPVGVALWPAVILHAAMAAWCLRSRLRNPAPAAK